MSSLSQVAFHGQWRFPVYWCLSTMSAWSEDMIPAIFDLIWMHHKATNLTATSLWVHVFAKSVFSNRTPYCLPLFPQVRIRIGLPISLNHLRLKQCVLTLDIHPAKLLTHGTIAIESWQAIVICEGRLSLCYSITDLCCAAVERSWTNIISYVTDVTVLTMPLVSCVFFGSDIHNWTCIFLHLSQANILTKSLIQTDLAPSLCQIDLAPSSARLILAHSSARLILAPSHCQTYFSPALCTADFSPFPLPDWF
jgi:hypothetical protein